MKQVTIENVKARISKIQSRGNAEYSLGLTLNEEFELACLRQLVELQERVAELEEHDREQMAELYRRNATIQRLQQQAAQASDLSALDNLAGEFLNVAINCNGKVKLAYTQCAHRLAETVRGCRAAMSQQSQEPTTDNTSQQFEALATSAQREPLAVVKHYTGNTYPTLKFAQDEWSVCGDREDVQELADAINALATSAGIGKP